MADAEERRESLGFRQRLGAQRTARADARHSVPTPSLTGRVTTSFRQELLSRRDTRIAHCHERYLHVEADIAATLEESDRHVATLRVRLQAATAALAAATEADVDVNARRRGDEKAPPELVSRRRRREHERIVQGLRGVRARLEAELDEYERRRVEQVQTGQRLRLSCAVDARLAHLSLLAQRDVYDRVLLRRHPLRQQLEYCLDTDIWPMPAWVESTTPRDDGIGSDDDATITPGSGRSRDGAHA